MHPDIAQLKNRLAACYMNQHQYDKAEPLLLDALHIREVRLGPHHSRVAQTLKHMISLYEQKGKETVHSRFLRKHMPKGKRL
jgi:hypothetical protein